MDDYAHPLKDYLQRTYTGTVIDTKPLPKEAKKPVSGLERILSAFVNRLAGKVPDIFADLKQAAEDRKRALGDDLLESFEIRDLPPPVYETMIYQQALDHFRGEGYFPEGIIGRGHLLKSREGEYLSVQIKADWNLFSVEIVRTRIEEKPED